jgi:hypothetical protein
MGIQAGLRRPQYAGDDPQMQQFERGVGDVVRFLQNLPFTDGQLFENVDFSDQAVAGVTPYRLTHTMKRKARGILVMSCKPKVVATPAVPADLPVHLPDQDTIQIAFVGLSQAMATDFVWSFWVW